jgi:hypothetical protein
LTFWEMGLPQIDQQGVYEADEVPGRRPDPARARPLDAYPEKGKDWLDRG